MTEAVDTGAEAGEEESKEGVISVTSKKTDRKVEFEKTFGTDLESAVEIFGDAVVFNLFNRQAVIACQSRVRGILNDSEKSPDEAVTAGVNFVPGVVTRTKSAAKDPVAALAKDLASGKIDMETLEEQLRAKLAEIGGISEE